LLGLAGSLGLALLTKATAYVYAAPFVLWFGLFLLKTYRWSAWRPVLISGAIVLLINSGHYYRNAQLFDSPLRPDSLDVFYINQTFGPTVFISNIVRNIALHLNLPVPFLLTSLDSLLRNLHNLLGLDPSDPRTTWPGTTFVLNPFHIHEDTSGNLVHLLLLFITCAFIMSKSKSRCVFEYALLLVSAFLLFVSYLKWQPWHTRLHLPLFILWSPLVGLVLSQFFQQTIVYLTIGLLLLQALPFIVLNPFHPILYPQNIFNLSRTEQYFLPEPSLLPAYGLTSQTIREKNCHYVGTIFPDDAWEYPFWILLHENNYTAQIEALEVENPSNILQNQTFIPCAVICLRCQDKHITLYTEKFGESKLHYGSNFLFIQ
jgi:hypothetical protein